MKKIILLTIVVLMTACSSDAPSAGDIETAIAQTQAVQPTHTPEFPEPTETQSPTDTPQPTATLEPTSTTVPFEKLDLETHLIREGDLPSGYSVSQVRLTVPEMFDDIPIADYTIYQRFQFDNETAGGVTVLVFEDLEDIQDVYDKITATFTEDMVFIDNVGEDANLVYTYFELLDMKMEFTDLAFTRCHAVVHIRMVDNAEADDVIAYAKRLDKRLQPLICR